LTELVLRMKRFSGRKRSLGRKRKRRRAMRREMRKMSRPQTMTRSTV